MIDPSGVSRRWLLGSAGLAAAAGVLASTRTGQRSSGEAADTSALPAATPGVPVSPTTRAPVPAARRGMIGMGLSPGEIAPYSGGYAFNDRMKGATKWTNFRSGTQGTTEGADGFPTSLGSGNEAWVRTCVYFPHDDPAVPGAPKSQRFHVRTNLRPSDGWRWSNAPNTRVSQTYAGGEYRMVVDCPTIESAPGVRAYRSLFCDKVGDRAALKGEVPYMHIVHEDDLHAFEAGEYFRAAWLAAFQGARFEPIRFMDWLKTNGSLVTGMAKRPKLSDPRWAQSDDWNSVPVEVCAALCNKWDVDGWFCVPHALVKPAAGPGARADYSEAKAYIKLILASLKPSRRAFIEPSNELWNFAFAQTGYMAELYKASTGKENHHYAGGGYFSALVARAAEEACAELKCDRNRLVTMQGVQTGYEGMFDQIVDGARTAARELGMADHAAATFADMGVDALAVTWYTGGIKHDVPAARAFGLDCAAMEGDAGARRAIAALATGTDPRTGAAAPEGVETVERVAERNARWNARALEHGVNLLGYEGGQNTGAEGWHQEVGKTVTPEQYTQFIALTKKMRDHPDYAPLSLQMVASQLEAGMAYPVVFNWSGGNTDPGGKPGWHREYYWGTIESLYANRKPRADALIAAQKVPTTARLQPLSAVVAATGDLRVGGEVALRVLPRGGRGIRRVLAVTGLPPGVVANARRARAVGRAARAGVYEVTVRLVDDNGVEMLVKQPLEIAA